MNNKYPTDEEILSMMAELEEEPLYAPPHLKDEILDKINQAGSSPASQKRQADVFLYNLKIIAGMAAALVMIFTMPHTRNTASFAEQIYEQQIEAAKNKYWNEETESSRIDKVFKMGTSALSDTADVFLDKINIFDSLYK